ncbi:MAG: TolC family protein [Elusimicrobia bacterium]|nr:TolC family protein [Elusimicrobiota bacterium]
MRKFLIHFSFSLLITHHSSLITFSYAEGRSISLDEAYQLALKRSETLAQQKEAVAQIQARIDELWGSIKPRFSLTGSQQWQDEAESSGFSSFTQTSRPQAAITGHQPLFSGFREYLAVKGARAQRESAELSLARAEQLLYQDVARSYLDLLGIHQEIATREAQVKITQNRIRELNSRERLGRSRKSEVLAVESQWAQTEAQLEESRGREKIFQAMLQFLTGVQENLVPQEVAIPSVENLSSFLERAHQRPDVESKRKELASSGLLTRIQKRQWWPSIALDGNYYLKRPAGFQESIKWDATVSAQMPLYWGGSVRAEVRGAEAGERSAQEALSLAERRAELEVRSAYSDLESSLSIVKALEKALNLAEANAKAQAEDYRLGLVTNLDVLGSLSTLQDTRLKLDQAKLAAYLARLQLEVAAGGPQ